MKILIGFTFLEIVIAILIVSLLAIIAIPSFIERKKLINQDMAAQVLLKDTQFLEKWKSMYGTYSKKIDGTGGCPEFPLRYAPESAGTPLYYISSGDSLCSKDRFTIKVRPICGTIQEAVGMICIDQDGNVLKSSNNQCFANNGGKPSIKDCVNSNVIPTPVPNKIDDSNNNGEVNPNIH